MQYLNVLKTKIIHLSFKNRQFYLIKLGCECLAIALACPHICCIKNTVVVYGMVKTLCIVLSHQFLIYPFSILLITLFAISLVKSSVRLLSLHHLLSCRFFQFFMYLKPVIHTQTQLKPSVELTIVSFVCPCNQKYSRHYNFLYQFIDTDFC